MENNKINNNNDDNNKYKNFVVQLDVDSIVDSTFAVS